MGTGVEGSWRTDVRPTLVYFCEGEKDTDRLHELGLVATTNPFGARKLDLVKDLSALENRRVVVLVDNDEVGYLHAREVAQILDPVAAEVRVLLLPGLPSKGDVSDWLHAGHTTAVPGLRLPRRAGPCALHSRIMPRLCTHHAASLWARTVCLRAEETVEYMITPSITTRRLAPRPTARLTQLREKSGEDVTLLCASTPYLAALVGIETIDARTAVMSSGLVKGT